MNILIAGHGNIGRAILSLLEEHPIKSIENIHVSELINGHEAISDITKLKGHLDVVINVTSHDYRYILPSCEKYDIHYIDTGFNLSSDIVDVLSVMENDKSRRIKMWGVGMNPGLIEYMYRRQNIDKSHVAIEFETDTAMASHSEYIFHTWSPECYFIEAGIEQPYAFVDGNMQLIARNEAGADMEIYFDGENRKYLWIPHEELYSMAKSNPYCKVCAFLYSAPQKAQEQAILSRKNEGLIHEIPVLHDISGYDSVGILIYDEDKQLTYVYNKADHQECYKKYSVNGTCWQVACGVYTALTLIPYLELGGYTFSTIPADLFSVIDHTLEKIDFRIQTSKNAISESEFLNKIISPFFHI